MAQKRQETIVRPKGDKKSKLSKQQTELYLQQPKQHDNCSLLKHIN